MPKTTHGSVLHVTITHVIYPMNEALLGQIFDAYGVNEVCLLMKQGHVEAFVEYRSWREATKARRALHARNIYDGCCLMDIQHAPPSVTVHRLSKTERVVVDWGRLEPEPPPDSSAKARNSKEKEVFALPHGNSSSVAKPSITLALNTDTNAIDISDVAAPPHRHNLATESEMLAASANRLIPKGAMAMEIPSDRPSFVTRPSSDPPAATAVYLPPETPKGRPASTDYGRRVAYVYITPEDAPCRARPGPFIRLVFRTLALDLPQIFEVHRCYSRDTDAAMYFRTPEYREAAIRRQPFVLDGATVKLLRDDETPGPRLVLNDYVVHAALHRYPVEQRTENKIKENCSGFGNVIEIDPACFAAHDLATVRVVIQLQDPGNIPCQLRIEYHDGSISVVPVEIVRVWHRSHSYADGQYVRIFQHPAVAA